MSEMYLFDDWNSVKKSTHNEKISFGIKNREIYYIKMGQNIGFEQNGKGDEFVRPVVILKAFNKSMFFGVPLSTQLKDGIFYYQFEFLKDNRIVVNIALLSQMRIFSTKRLLNKIGVISKSDFEELKNKIKKLIN